MSGYSGSYTFATPPISAAGQTFAVPISALDKTHIYVFIDRVDASTLGGFTIGGTSGAWTVTMPQALTPANQLIFSRKTPPTFGTQLAVFAAGTPVTADAMATLQKQVLYLLDELRDQGQFSLGLNIGADRINDEPSNFGTAWRDSHITAGGKRIHSVGAPVDSQDAARLADVQAISLGSGNLPSPAGVPDGYTLVVNGGMWGVQSPATLTALFGLGTAAFFNVDTGGGAPISVAAAQAAYMAKANNLSDVANVATARASLGLGTAAVCDTGVTVGKVPVLDAAGQFFAGIKGQQLDMTGNRVYGRNGGHLDAFCQIDYGPNSATGSPVNLRQDAATATTLNGAWASTAANGRNLPATPLTAVLNNGSADFAGTGGAPSITLKQGSYLVSIRALIKVGTAAEIGWGLIGTTGSVTINGLTYTQAQVTQPGAVSFGSDGLVVVSSATAVVALRMASSQANSEVLQINLTFRKVND